MRQKTSCVCVATSNITVASTQNGSTVGGHVLADGERLLLVGQTDASENGIYVSGASSITRATDADATADFDATFLVYAGSSVYRWDYVASLDVGTDDITFTALTTTAVSSGTVTLAARKAVGTYETLAALRAETNPPIEAIITDGRRFYLNSSSEASDAGDETSSVIKPTLLGSSGVGRMLGVPGGFKNAPRPMMLITGILRNSGDGWEALDDGTHEPIGGIAVTDDTSKITITPADGYTNVHWACAATDETFAQAGVIAGPRIASASMDVYLYQNRLNYAYIYYDGAAWQYSLVNGITGVSWGSNKLTITHGQFNSLGANYHSPQVTVRGGGCIACCEAVQAGSSEVLFFDYSGVQITTPSTAMKIYFAAHGGGPLNPTTCINALANIWFAALVS